MLGLRELNEPEYYHDHDPTIHLNPDEWMWDGEALGELHSDLLKIILQQVGDLYGKTNTAYLILDMEFWSRHPCG